MPSEGRLLPLLPQEPLLLEEDLDWEQGTFTSSLSRWTLLLTRWNSTSPTLNQGNCYISSVRLVQVGFPCQNKRTTSTRTPTQKGLDILQEGEQHAPAQTSTQGMVKVYIFKSWIRPKQRSRCYQGSKKKKQKKTCLKCQSTFATAFSGVIFSPNFPSKRIISSHCSCYKL